MAGATTTESRWFECSPTISAGCTPTVSAGLVTPAQEALKIVSIRGLARKLKRPPAVVVSVRMLACELP